MKQETKQIKYTKGYKYMLEEDTLFYTGIILQEDFITKRVIHFKDGWMLIKEGFGWDGCSGPTWDDQTNMRAGLCHDGMYELHRCGFPLEYRCFSDEKLGRLMIEDKALSCRAKYYKFAVRKFGKSSALPKNQRKILIAPSNI